MMRAGERPLSLLRLPDVRSQTGLSRSEIYRRMAAGRFPRPVKVGPNISAWNSREIDQWVAEVIDAAQSGGAAS